MPIKVFCCTLVFIAFFAFFVCITEANADVTDVYAKYVCSNSSQVHAKVTQGGSEVCVIKDKLTVEVNSDCFDVGISLVVHCVQPHETEPYRWFKSCTIDMDNPIYLDIYFVDSSGMRVDIAQSADIIFRTESGYTVKDVYLLDRDGRLHSANATVEENIIKFTIMSAGYYVIEGTCTTPPATGGHSTTVLLPLFLLCAAILIVSTSNEKLRKQFRRL